MLICRLDSDRPVVDVLVVSARLGEPGAAIRRFELALDFTTTATVITTGDLATGPMALDDLSAISDSPGVAAAYVARSVVSFLDEDGTNVGYQIEIRIVVGPAGHSRLGRDVLGRWLVVVDATEGLLVLEPRSWDFRTPSA